MPIGNTAGGCGGFGGGGPTPAHVAEAVAAVETLAVRLGAVGLKQEAHRLRLIEASLRHPRAAKGLKLVVDNPAHQTHVSHVVDNRRAELSEGSRWVTTTQRFFGPGQIPRYAESLSTPRLHSDTSALSLGIVSSVDGSDAAGGIGVSSSGQISGRYIAELRGATAEAELLVRTLERLGFANEAEAAAAVASDIEADCASWRERIAPHLPRESTPAAGRQRGSGALAPTADEYWATTNRTTQGHPGTLRPPPLTGINKHGASVIFDWPTTGSGAGSARALRHTGGAVLRPAGVGSAAGGLGSCGGSDGKRGGEPKTGAAAYVNNLRTDRLCVVPPPVDPRLSSNVWCCSDVVPPGALPSAGGVEER